MAWAELILAFFVFFISHSVTVRPPIKSWIVSGLGMPGFTLAYSILSLLVLAWLIIAAGRAPFIELWPWEPWQSHLTLALMLIACLVLAAAIGSPNPFSFGGTANDRFDPLRPGIVCWTRHPFLTAIALWAIAHLIPNGNLAHVFLFGTFAVFALLGGRLIDRRVRREMGDDWQHLLKKVRERRGVQTNFKIEAAIYRLAAGLALFLGLIWAHPWIFGVSPLP